MIIIPLAAILLTALGQIKIQLHQNQGPTRLRHLRSLRLDADNHEHYFTIPMSVNGVNYNMLFDSGSSRTVFKGVGCKGIPKKKLDCKDCKDSGQITIKYGDGPIVGRLKSVNLHIGQTKISDVVVVQAEECAKKYVDIQGILGTKFRDQPGSLFKQLIDRKIINKVIITLDLSVSSQKNYVVFGEEDYSSVADPTTILRTTLDLSDQKYQINPTIIRVGNTQVSKIDFAVIIDSGSSCISMATPVAKAFWKQIQKRKLHQKCGFKQSKSNGKYWKFKCFKGLTYTQIVSLPDIIFQVQDKQIQLTYLDYILSCQQFSSGLFECNFLLQELTSPKLYIGLPFFNSHIVFLNLESRQVGMSLRALRRTQSNIFMDK